MYYETVISILPLATIEDPVVQVLQVAPGVVQHVEVYFPDRCAGLARLRIMYWERQVWPSNPDGFFRGNDSTTAFDEDLEIVDPPYSFDIQGWNLDDTFLHEPIVRVQIMPTDKVLRNILGRLAIGPSGPVSTGGG